METKDHEINAKTHTFTDRKGREWDATLTLLAARRVDASDFTELYGGTVSLLEPDQDLFRELLQNKPLAMAVVWVIVQPQAEEIEGDDYTQDTFLDGLDGTTLQEAMDCLWETLGSFFPQAKTALSTLREIREAMEKRAVAGLAKASEKVKGRIMAEIDAHLETLEKELEALPLGGKSSPASPASDSPPTSDSP